MNKKVYRIVGIIAGILLLILLCGGVVIFVKKKSTGNLSLVGSKIGEPMTKETEIKNTEADHGEMWGAYILGGEAGYWEKNLVANEQYIFYITKNQIIRLDRAGKEKRVLYQNDTETYIALCLDDQFLYYLIDEKEIYRMDFAGENTEKVISFNMLQKEDLEILSISGMKIYNNRLYLHEKVFGYVMQFIPEKNEVKLIAHSVYAAEFFDDSLFYVDENKRCIYKVDLDTGKEEVVRKHANQKKKEFIYTDLYSVNEKLYYVRRDKQQIFCYSEKGKDVVIGGKRKHTCLIECIDDKLYHIFYEKETYNANLPMYLAVYDGNDNTVLRLLPEDFDLPAMVIGNKLYYEATEEEDNDYYKECSCSG